MPRSKRVSAGGYVYHVLNRGADGMALFDEQSDYAAFERVLAEALKREPGVRLLGYCLMPNHWHLMLWPRRNGELSEFMRWLTVTHTQRWHAHFQTAGTGPVYQGRFKSFPVKSDQHLLTAMRYVECNAARAARVKRAEQWRWGSLWRWENRRTPAGRDPELPPISDWPVPRPRNWKQTVNTPLSEAEAETLRRCIKRGTPFGNKAWTTRTATRLDLQATLNPIGRPRKRHK